MSSNFVKPKFIESTPRVSAVVLFSGGLDSLVSLLWAQKKYGEVLAVSFNYDQAHVVELNAAQELCARLTVVHRVVPIGFLGELSKGALIAGNDAAEMFDGDDMHGSLFVPCRNPILLSIAAGVAMCHGARVLVVGEGQSDGTPFPDARKEFFSAMQRALSLSLGIALSIQTPLMGKTKGWGLKLGAKLHQEFLDLAAMSISCYRGHACGDCPACLLRARGFEELGVEDPRKRLTETAAEL
jgi:7-cyano-7-deazaguanine synthase